MNIIVTEETEHGDIPIDIYSKLAGDRILFLHDHIDDRLATDVMATMMLKDSENCESKISLFINSPGGDLSAVFMIYDTMKMIQSPVETICVGEAFDEAVLLLAAGTPGMRYTTSNAIICASQLLSKGMLYSDIADAFITMERLKNGNLKFITALSKMVKKPVKSVMSHLEKKKFFTPKQAMQYGIVDSIVKSSKV